MTNESKTPLRDYFNYTRGERVGVIVLVGVIVVFAILPSLIPLFIKKEATDFTAYKQEIEAFKSSLVELDEDGGSGVYEKKSYNNNVAAASLFDFDPNSASEADFIKLGLSSKTAGTILKYRSKGPWNNHNRAGKHFGALLSESNQAY